MQACPTKYKRLFNSMESYPPKWRFLPFGPLRLSKSTQPCSRGAFNRRSQIGVLIRKAALFVTLLRWIQLCQFRVMRKEVPLVRKQHLSKRALHGVLRAAATPTASKDSWLADGHHRFMALPPDVHRCHDVGGGSTLATVPLGSICKTGFSWSICSRSFSACALSISRSLVREDELNRCSL